MKYLIQIKNKLYGYNRLDLLKLDICINKPSLYSMYIKDSGKLIESYTETTLENELKAEFLNECERIALCPYCMNEIEIEPTSLCCGEVHGEYGYQHKLFDEPFLRSEIDEHYRLWLEARKQP